MYSAPPTPAYPALMPNVATFVRARLTPIDAADTGLSRTDIIARPQRPRTMFQASQNRMMATTTQNR